MTVLVPRMLSRLEDLLEWDGPATHLIRVEEQQQDGVYRIRAELPGMDAKDIKVSVDHGMLIIDAERSEEKKDNYRSEFRYGSLHRSAALPAGAEEQKIHASYDKGILEITVPVGEKKPSGRTIPIEAAK
ncbi:Hsp20/alpha crystallin family protein [Catelliglobosispora koreensis]|uniref:Hsp20/alpha crystallin family protein n=1 Tax=Catelliglobosispora koreensis TaxID=129052 RepID=UPI0003740DE9|nr:Hsp20/alpha crystallin family protein [Catelliglobosispora koreensis]